MLLNNLISLNCRAKVNGSGFFSLSIRFWFPAICFVVSAVFCCCCLNSHLPSLDYIVNNDPLNNFLMNLIWFVRLHPITLLSRRSGRRILWVSRFFLRSSRLCVRCYCSFIFRLWNFHHTWSVQSATLVPPQTTMPQTISIVSVCIIKFCLFLSFCSISCAAISSNQVDHLDYKIAPWRIIRATQCKWIVLKVSTVACHKDSFWNWLSCQHFAWHETWVYW